MAPGGRTKAVTWAIDEKNYSQHRAARWAACIQRPGATAAVGSALRRRLRELAAERPRFGYRGLLILLRREAFEVNHERQFRFYREKRLIVRKLGAYEHAHRTRAPLRSRVRSDQRWSLGFVSHVVTNGRRFRLPGVRGGFSRKCPALVAEASLSGRRVACERDRLAERREPPSTIAGDTRALADRAIHPEGGRGQQTSARQRVHLARHPPSAAKAGRGLAGHCLRQTDTERLRREPHGAVARRAPNRATNPQPLGRPSDFGTVPGRRRRRMTLDKPRRPDALSTASRRTTTPTAFRYERGQSRGNVIRHRAAPESAALHHFEA